LDVVVVFLAIHFFYTKERLYCRWRFNWDFRPVPRDFFKNLKIQKSQIKLQMFLKDSTQF
jgi:hypothetical protein